jgi:hypothetical protein
VAITLRRLVATGPGQVDADVVFHPVRCLIRGPSDTGKSYIRDCLWYLLGGDRVPKPLPEAHLYDGLRLEFLHDSVLYEVRRAIAGGASAVSKSSLSPDGLEIEEPLDIDEGELLVQLSNAGGRKILRSTSDKGAVTGGDLRHWFLLSQPTMISEEATSGAGFDKTQRVAAFNLFLTGNDDSAIELRKSTAEVERIKGQLSSAEDALRRVQAGISSETTRGDVEDAFTRVGDALSAMKSQYDARAAILRELRASISAATERLNRALVQRDHSSSMIERFELLDSKYASDLERLGATNEGIAFFEALPETECPLCGTPAELQLDPKQLKAGAAGKYRKAVIAEAAKISVLRAGLHSSLSHELARVRRLDEEVTTLQDALSGFENQERRQLTGARVEFSADPKTLAERHSELSGQLAIFDEMQRLSAEIERLKKAKVRRRVEVTRDGGADGMKVASYVHEMLVQWGFEDITSVSIDALECDLVINGRARLSYGAGKRAIFLTSLAAALMRHSLEANHPHLGVVVIDSPLKAYADPAKTENPDVPVSTVTERFYSWLARWNGPGQLVILENERIRSETAVLLSPIQFTGLGDDGRAGFYPIGQLM